MFIGNYLFSVTVVIFSLRWQQCASFPPVGILETRWLIA
jgi:hypothetical protein